MTWRRVLVGVVVLAACALAIAGCGGEAGSDLTGGQVVVQESGSIEPGDARDPNYSDLPYDGYTFESKGPGTVRVEVLAQDFTPLLDLVQLPTGASSMGWEKADTDEDEIIFFIDAPGIYEVRVYAMGGETGAYQINVILDD